MPAADPCKEDPFKEMNYLDAPPLPVVRGSLMFMKPRFRRKGSQRRHLLQRHEQGLSETGVPPLIPIFNSTLVSTPITFSLSLSFSRDLEETPFRCLLAANPKIRATTSQSLSGQINVAEVLKHSSVFPPDILVQVFGRCF